MGLAVALDELSVDCGEPEPVGPILGSALSEKHSASGKHGPLDSCHFFDTSHDLAAIAEFVVIPAVKDATLAACGGILRIKDARIPVTDEIRGDDFIRGGVANLLLQRGEKGLLPDEFVDLFATNFCFELEHQNG